MTEQTTIKEEVSIRAAKLKDLLRQNKRETDMGDVSKWEHIPQQYIITANTLRIELNDSVLEKLNSAEDKESALYSVVICQYFKDKARDAGKPELANKLEALLKNDLKPEETAAYASRLVEGTLPEDELKEAFEKTFLANADNLKLEILSKTARELCGKLKENRPESREKLRAALQDAKGLVNSLEEGLESGLEEEIKFTPGKYDTENYYGNKVYGRNGNTYLGKIVAVHFDPVTMQAEWLLKRRAGFFKKEYFTLPLPLHCLGNTLVTRLKPQKTEGKVRFKRMRVLHRNFRPYNFKIGNKGKILRLVYRCDKISEAQYRYVSIDADNMEFENNSIIIKDLTKVQFYYNQGPDEGSNMIH